MISFPDRLAAADPLPVLDPWQKSLWILKPLINCTMAGPVSWAIKLGMSLFSSWRALSVTLASAVALPSVAYAGPDNSFASIDYLEYVAAEGTDQLALEAVAGVSYSEIAYAMKLTAQKPLDDDLSDAEMEFKVTIPVAGNTDVFIGGKQGLLGSEENTAFLTGLATEIMDGYSISFEFLLSEKGRQYGKIELSGESDIDQIWIEPKLELYWSAQNVPESEIGAGADALSLALRAGPIVSRKIRPYAGILYSTRLSNSKTYALASGEEVDSLAFTAGLRLLF